MANLQNYKIGVTIDGDASKLQSEAKKADKAIEGIGGKGFASIRQGIGETADAFGLIPQAAGPLGGIAESFSGITSSAGLAGIAIGAAGIAMTATVGAGILLGKTLFDLARQASDFGSEIKDAQEITGLSAEALTALKFAAEQGGKTLDDVTSATGKFAKQLYAAKEGNEEAQATMKALGVTSYDLETALGQSFKAIQNNTEGLDQMGISQKAYGKSGAELLPVIKAMEGGFQSFIQRAKELGITLTEEDIRAADEFGDTLGLLQTQAKVTATVFALEFAPEITDAMNSITRAFAENKDEIRFWGGFVGDILRGIPIIASETSTAVSNILNGLSSRVQFLTGNLLDLKTAFNIATLGGNSAIAAEWEKYNELRGSTVSGSIGGDLVNSQAFFPQSDADAKKENGERERFERETAQGREQLNKALAEGDLKAFKTAQDNLKKYYENNRIAQDFFKESFLKNEQTFLERYAALTNQRYDLELAREKNPTKQKAIQQRQVTELTEIKRESSQRIEEIEIIIAQGVKKEQDKVLADNKDFVQKLTEDYRVKITEMNSWTAFEAESLRKQTEDGLISELALINRVFAEKKSVIETEIAQKTALQKLYKEDSNEFKLLEIEIRNLQTELSGLERNRVQDRIDWYDKEIERLEKIEEIERERIRNAKFLGLDKPEGVSPLANGDAPDLSPGSYRERDADSFGGGLFGSSGVSRFEEEASRISSASQLMGDTVGNVIGGMIDAGANLLNQWILTGEGSADAFAQLAASVISGIAMQAGVKAIFELAEGIAAASNPFTAWMAPGHFLAAKTYGIIAGAAAGTGLAIGAAGGLQGSKGSKVSSSTSGGFNNSADQTDNRQFSFIRDSNIGSNQNQSATQLQQTVNELRASVQGLTAANQALQSRIATQPAGVLVANGIKENRGLVSETVISEMSKNSTTASNFGRLLGVS